MPRLFQQYPDQKFVQGIDTQPDLTQYAKTAGGVLPGIGDAISAYDAYKAFQEGNYGEAGLNALGVLPFIPSLGGITAFHRTRAEPFTEFAKNRRSEYSFAGDQGLYFSRDLNDPTTSIFGTTVAKADVNIKKPAPIYQIPFGSKYQNKQGELVDATAARTAIPVTASFITKHNEDINKGGYVIANSLDDVIAGKFDYIKPLTNDTEVEALKNSFKNGNVYKLVDPERISNFDAALLKEHNYDGFIYKKPQLNETGAPSQVVALDPSQVSIQDWFRDNRWRGGDLEQLQYKDPLGDTTK